MPLLHWKNGTITEDVTPAIAEAVAKLPPDKPRSIEVPQAELWLSQRADEIREKDQLAQSLKIERELVLKKMDSVRAGVKNAYGNESFREAQAQKGDRVMQHYDDELKELDCRIKRASDLAAQIRGAVATFHENTPDWPKILRQYKAGSALGEQGVLGGGAGHFHRSIG